MKWNIPFSFLLGFVGTTALAQEKQLADVIEQVMAGVVNIRATVPNSPSESQIASELFSQKSVDNFFQMFLLPGGLSKLGQSRASGSGFFYKSREFIVTNYHVIQDASRIEIVTSPEEGRTEAKLVGFDAKSDIALLRVRPQPDTKSLRFGAAAKLRIGETLFAIGNPFGYGHTVTRGILSAKGRTIGAGPLNDFLQTDVAINPGNSGGPLFNMRGEVIGINTATSNEGYGISFAIPSEIAFPVIQRLMGETRVANKVWLGIVASNIDDQDSSANGVFVQNLVKDSPAAMAGLKVGDVILKINDKPAKSVNVLRTTLQNVRERNNKVSLNVFRRGEQIKFDVAAARVSEIKQNDPSL